MIEEGALVFYHDPVASWVLGSVVSWDGKKGDCKPKEGLGEQRSGLKEDDITIAREDTIDEDKDDLMSLTLLHDATILRSLKIRYMRDVIYTNIGPIVVALNPFNFKIPWYTDDNMPKYLAEGDRIENNLPHSWAVAHNTYYEMLNDSQDQCILVSGESGAGKTEASKIVMKYLAAVSTRSGTQEQKQAGLNVGRNINMTSPPLETWGNAKTVRNDNSSRFGKFMKVRFNPEGLLVGAYVIKYLLEKSRIVVAGPGERCYHSFYLAVRGKDAADFGLTSDQAFKSITSGKVVNNKEFDSAEEYDEVCTALREIGTPDHEVVSMWKIVAGILHLQNVCFDPDGEGSTINSGTEKDLDQCVAIWGCDKAMLRKELCITTLFIQGSPVEKLLSPVKAADCRDSLSKHLYDNEFSKLIEKCNELLDLSDGSGNWIGLLDIFGFEDFEVNSFEQLCINLANESLQHHYNTYIFKRDMDECRAEGIDVTEVEFPDNTPCLQMVSAKHGIMALLDEECSLGKGSDEGFLAKVLEHHSSNQFFGVDRLAKNSFIVHHYAKSVKYTIDGFLDKNRDTLKDAFKNMMRSCEDPYIKELLPEPNPDAKGPKITVGGFYKQQLKELMDLINSTNPHWIRCIKPHPAKKPLHFDGVSTLAQLSSSGVLGTVKIRKAGFPVRISHEEFYQKYRVLVPGAGAGVESCKKILEVAGVNSTSLAQNGKSKVFMKTEAFITLEVEKKARLTSSAEIVQAFARALKDLGAVRKQILENNKTLLDSMREEYKKELEERRRKEAEEAAANATRLAAEQAEREARELAERMANASKVLLEEEEAARGHISEEEAVAWAGMLEEEETLRQELLFRQRIWMLEQEESRERHDVEEEEAEAFFEFCGVGAELQQRMDLEKLRIDAEKTLAKNRQERQRREVKRKELSRAKQRSLVERLAVPNSPVLNTEAFAELQAQQEETENRAQEDRLAAEAQGSSPFSSPHGSPVGRRSQFTSPAGTPTGTAPHVLRVLPSGTQSRGQDGALNSYPIEVLNTSPPHLVPGTSVYVPSHRAIAVITDNEPGNKGQFRVRFNDGQQLWCSPQDVCDVSQGWSPISPVPNGGYSFPTRSISQTLRSSVSVSPVPGPHPVSPATSQAGSTRSWGAT